MADDLTDYETRTQQRRFQQPRNSFTQAYDNRKVYSTPPQQQIDTTDWMERIGGQRFMTALLMRVNKQLNRRITEAEEMQMRSYVTSVNPRLFAQMNDDMAVSALARGYVDSIHRGRTNEQVDMHEILKAEVKETSESGQSRMGNDRQNMKMKRVDPRIAQVHVDSFMGNQTPFDILNLFNPEALIVEQRVEFDSHFRLAEFPMNNKRYNWAISFESQRSKGTANIIGSKIRDIVGIELLPIRLPTPTNSAGLTTYKQVKVAIPEFQAQSYSAANGKFYHFIMRPTADTADYFDLNPIGSVGQGGIIRFDKKITRFDSISLTFNDSVNDLTLAADRLLSTLWAYGNPTTITVEAAHTLNNGDLVSIDDFTTTNTAADRNLIRLMNTGSYAVTVTAANQFTIPVDSSAIVGPNTTLSIPIFIEKRRMFVYMKIKYMTPEDTYP